MSVKNPLLQGIMKYVHISKAQRREIWGMGITEKELKEIKKGWPFHYALNQRRICIPRKATDSHSILNHMSCSIGVVSTITEFYGLQFGWCNWIIRYIE